MTSVFVVARKDTTSC